MNKKEMKLLVRLEAKIENIQENIEYLRRDTASLIKGNWSQDMKIAVLQNSFTNHLKEHGRNLKLIIFGFGVITTIIGLILRL